MEPFTRALLAAQLSVLMDPIVAPVLTSCWVWGVWTSELFVVGLQNIHSIISFFSFIGYVVYCSRRRSKSPRSFPYRHILSIRSDPHNIHTYATYSCLQMYSRLWRHCCFPCPLPRVMGWGLEASSWSSWPSKVDAVIGIRVKSGWSGRARRRVEA